LRGALESDSLQFQDARQVEHQQQKHRGRHGFLVGLTLQRKKFFQKINEKPSKIEVTSAEALKKNYAEKKPPEKDVGAENRENRQKVFIKALQIPEKL